MLCLVNAFRRSHGRRGLSTATQLQRAARLKARAIDRCDTFSHTPCGRSFSSTFVQTGYGKGAWAGGENIAWGTGVRGTVEETFRALLASPPHRANFLHASWRDVGIALRRGTMFGHPDVSLWVIDFGRR